MFSLTRIGNRPLQKMYGILFYKINIKIPNYEKTNWIFS